MFQKAVPGYCAIQRVDASAARVPISAIVPSDLWLLSSSSSGSTTIIIMPKTDSTSSGRMRM